VAGTCRQAAHPDNRFALYAPRRGGGTGLSPSLRRSRKPT